MIAPEPSGVNGEFRSPGAPGEWRPANPMGRTWFDSLVAARPRGRACTAAAPNTSGLAPQSHPIPTECAER